MKKVIRAIPTVFSLRGNDYDHFVIVGGAKEMMRATWAGVGAHMDAAITKVVSDQVLHQQNKKEKLHVRTKEAAKA